jgi:hypothetical protein
MSPSDRSARPQKQLGGVETPQEGHLMSLVQGLRVWLFQLLNGIYLGMVDRAVGVSAVAAFLAILTVSAVTVHFLISASFVSSSAALHLATAVS